MSSKMRLIVSLVLACVTGSMLAARQSVCNNCGGPGGSPGFLVKAFNGTILKNGGKCLDYLPESAGSALFLNDCFLAHPVTFEKVSAEGFDVFLRAGSRYVGVRRPGPPGAIETAGDVTPAPGQRVLELQTQGVLGGPCDSLITAGPCVIDQAFALDGDSIILASNRRLVARVQNGRGANETPIVLAPRTLGSAEFWDIRATDGSGRPPTDAFVTVTTALNLATLLPPSYVCGPHDGQPDPCTGRARAGMVITIDGRLEQPGDLPTLEIPAGVTVRGDRRGIRLANELARTTLPPEGTRMMEVVGDNVRVTGLTLHGPSGSTEGEQPQSVGIAVNENLIKNTIIDHNDVNEFTWRGVEVLGDEPRYGPGALDCGLRSDPHTRTTTTWVARNFIQRNREQEKGYGVSVHNGAFPLIDGNVFLDNRHAIASSPATPSTGYRAWNNLVLRSTPLQRKTFHTHDFDVHGMDSGGKGGRAGGYVDVWRNTFFGTDRANFELRGTPCDFIDVHENISLQSKDDTLSVDFGFFAGLVLPIDAWGTARFMNVESQPRQFNQPDPTKRFGAGDFDGDGLEDLFLATGTAWYYSPGGISEWRFLAARQERFDDLLFGDVDGDGRTDVLAKEGANLVASWGGESEWDPVIPIDAPISQLAVGDFDGSGRDDIFYGDGVSWFVAFNGGPFVEANTSSFRVPQLRFGDFNGNGTTDVFNVGPSVWRFSDGATAEWATLRPRLSNNVTQLIIADVDGNGVDDVATITTQVFAFGAVVYTAKFSPGGVGNWTTMATTRLEPAMLGPFVPGDPRAALLVWTGDVLARLMVGDAALTRHSRQNLR